MPFFAGFIDDYDSSSNFTISSGDIVGYTPASGDRIVGAPCPKGEAIPGGYAAFTIQIDPDGIGPWIWSPQDDQMSVIFSVAHDGNLSNSNYYEIEFHNGISNDPSRNHTTGFSTSDGSNPRDGSQSSPYFAQVDHRYTDGGSDMGVPELIDSLESIFRNSAVGTTTDFAPGDIDNFSTGWSFTRDESSDPATITITSDSTGQNYNFIDDTIDQYTSSSIDLSQITGSSSPPTGGISDNVATWFEWDSLNNRWLVYCSDTNYTGDIAFHVVTPS